MAIEQRERIQAFGIGNPTGPARGDTGQAPTDIVAAAQLRLFRNEQAEQCAANIAETDESEVIEWNGSLG